MGFLSLGLGVVMDRSCQLCSGIPGEHIFFQRVFLIFRRCILTALACYGCTYIYYAFGRSATFVRPVPTGTPNKPDKFVDMVQNQFDT